METNKLRDYFATQEDVMYRGTLIEVLSWATNKIHEEYSYPVTVYMVPIAEKVGVKIIELSDDDLCCFEYGEHILSLKGLFDGL